MIEHTGNNPLDMGPFGIPKSNVIDFQWRIAFKATRSLGIRHEAPGIEYYLKHNTSAAKIVSGYSPPSQGMLHDVGIYFLWHGGRISYIGQSQGIPKRIIAHRKSGKAFDSVGTVGIVAHRPESLDSALSIIEALLIGMFKPRDNKCIPPNSEIKSKSAICKRLSIGSDDFDMMVTKGSLPMAFEFNGTSYWYDYDFDDDVCFLSLDGGTK